MVQHGARAHGLGKKQVYLWEFVRLLVEVRVSRVDRVDVQIGTIEPRQQMEFFKAYEEVFSSRKEVERFYGRFIANGWTSGAWKNGELIGVLSWTPREAVKHGLAEIVDFWVRVEERRKGIGGKLIDHAIIQMEQYYESFGTALSKVMLFTGASDRFLAARNLYEKKRFQVAATIPKNALDNPYGDDLLYVLQV